LVALGLTLFCWSASLPFGCQPRCLSWRYPECAGFASAAANIRGVEFDLASDSFVAIDQRRFLPDLPDSRAEDDSTAGGGLQSSEPSEPVDAEHQPALQQLSPMSFKNFGQITNDISGNNGLNAADYRIIQMAVKFAF
jgi:hypothetical protein